MGTNFYWSSKPCDHCGEAKIRDKHIGKSSGGWCFSLHVYPDENINTLDDWKQRFASGVIHNEYGELVTPEAMLSCITERPKDSQRHSREWSHIAGYGEGTWDYLTGEFS